MSWARTRRDEGSLGEKEAREYALDLLSQRAYSTSRMERKLRDRGATARVAASTIRSLIDAGLLNDGVYAENLARERLTIRGNGPARIRRDLIQRGIDSATIDCTMAGLQDTSDSDIREAAERAAMKWLRIRKGAPDRVKLLRHIVAKGFSYPLAKDLVDKLLPHR